MKVGVLALQGAFIEHIDIMQRLGAEAVTVRLPSELKELDALIIPGGESTTMQNLMAHYGLIEPIQKLAKDGLPIFGTCAGLICLASHIPSNSIGIVLGVMEITAKRNAFGRQVDSFETEVAIPALGDKPFPAVFIRAPIIESVGASVEVLAKLGEDRIIAVRQGKMLATAFHPELTADTRLHEYFLKIINSKA